MNHLMQQGNQRKHAEALLEQAIALHAKHMNGTAPTTGAAGMQSQMEMMRLMQLALRAMKGELNPLAGALLGAHRR